MIEGLTSISLLLCTFSLVATIAKLPGCTFQVLLHHDFPSRVHPPSRPSSARWCHRAYSPSVGPEVQLRQDDLPQVLRQVGTVIVYRTVVPGLWLMIFSTIGLTW